MKSPDVIRARITRLLVRELHRRVGIASERLPVRCTHNYRHPLDPRRTVDGEPNPNYNRILPVNQTIGLCMLGAEDPSEWPGNICEDPIDAQRCPYFEVKQTKAQVWAELREQLKEPSWVEENLPEVAALAWTLNEAPDLEGAAQHVDAELAPEPELENLPETDGPVDLVPMSDSWWRRLLRWLFSRGSGA